jgi:hypothetical protein
MKREVSLDYILHPNRTHNPHIEAVLGAPLRECISSYVAQADLGADRQLHLKLRALSRH